MMINNCVMSINYYNESKQLTVNPNPCGNPNRAPYPQAIWRPFGIAPKFVVPLGNPF